MKHLKIALDGPAGAGKSSLAKELARRMNILYVDTGALYRTVALAAARAGIPLSQGGLTADEIAAIVALLPSLSIEIAYVESAQHVILGGEDVNPFIRGTEMSNAASAVSKIPEVRAYLLGIQRTVAEMQSVIMDGRDIGTVILPDADVKIFLDARPEVRAMRRLQDLRDTGKTVNGEEPTLENVMQSLIGRDHADRTRAIAPAIPADDAVILDNSELDFEGTVRAALALIADRCGGFD